MAAVDGGRGEEEEPFLQWAECDLERVRRLNPELDTQFGAYTLFLHGEYF